MEPDELLDLQGDVEAPDEGLGLWHKVVLQETTRAECMNALDAALKDYDVIAA